MHLCIYWHRMECTAKLWVPHFLLLILAVSQAAGKCGYESCPKPKEGYLNIHVVPHSHDDIGWLKTVDQYYYGDRNSIQLGAVQYILDSVVSELQKSPERRFIYVETGFFWRWWTNRDEKTHQVVRNLVSNGQLEFINGGWCMNDEATTHYNAIIDQMTLGLRYLNDTFGQCALPRVAWQIDPFGHSREQASLFAHMGFDGLFFGRLDYQDKFFRRIQRNMEMIWSGSPDNLGKDSWLFTGVLFNGYNPPDGYCFDIFCGDEPIMDDPKLLGYNLERKVEDFIKISEYWGTPYRTKNVLMTMGSDFQYMAAYTWYQNLDKLIQHVNARQGNGSMVNLFYSTPSCYLQEVNKANLNWTVKSDDFFPYASDPHAFWTGYFTSRPTLKYFVHSSNNILQACQQLAAMTDESGEMLEGVFKLAEPVAVTQHHDAVAGTAKQHVTDDYALRLSIGISACEKVMSEALRKVETRARISISNDISQEQTRSGGDESASQIPTYHINDANKTEYSVCLLLNISACEISELKSSFLVAVYNPLAREVCNSYIRLPVSTPTWQVQGPQGDIPTQSIPLPSAVLEIPGRQSAAQYELVFPAGALPGLSVTNFRLTRVVANEIVRPKLEPTLRHWKATAVTLPTVRGLKDMRRRDLPRMSSVIPNEDFTIENSVGISVDFDGTTGMVKKIRRGGSEMSLEQNFFYYRGMKGNNSDFDRRASGAYIFRPNGTQPIPVATSAEYCVYTGDHVTEVHQVFSSWISQVIRLYDRADALEFEWLVGPIPIEDHVGKEIVTRYSTDLRSDGIFFTDSNGRELLRRQRNKRPTWPYKVYEPVSGNYYPVNSRMVISERGTGAKRTLVVLNDRAQGGTSMNDGELELMVHRRLLYDDAFGVGEALNEEAFGTGLVARGKHWIVFAGDKTGVPVSIHRPLAQEIFMNRVLAFREIQESDGEDSSGGHSLETVVSVTIPLPDLSTTEHVAVKQVTWLSQYSKLGRILPANCHLLTLKKLTATEYLIRFEHIYERNEDEKWSRNIEISLKSLQEVLQFKSIRETTLAANQWKDEATRLHWNIMANSTGEEAFELHLEPTVQKTRPTRHVHQDEAFAAAKIVLTPMQIRTFIFEK